MQGMSCIYSQCRWVKILCATRLRTVTKILNPQEQATDETPVALTRDWRTIQPYCLPQLLGVSYASCLINAGGVLEKRSKR